jgi:hypothetical protein
LGANWQGPKPNFRNLRWACDESGQDLNP